jgi:predicted NAD-dependent protein-ADP-ribosyltransferase YbiA (DUF1768 family)
MRCGSHVIWKWLAALAPAVALIADARAELSDADALKFLFANLHRIEEASNGLYALDNDKVVVGSHRLQLRPIIDRQAELPGRGVIALHVEVRLDGRALPEAAVAATAVGESAADAASVALGEWHVGFGLPLFRALKGSQSADFTLGSFSGYAGLLGLSGDAPGQSWIDGSAAMHARILKVLEVTLPTSDLAFLDLKISIRPDEPPTIQCGVNGEFSPEAASALAKLDWPRLGDGYIVRQCYVLTRTQQKQLGAHFPFPEQWWAAAPREGAPAWEILPQDAKPGEVILSKRNELGILSNFAPTPFLFRGQRYASVEGFWQMMKYPENADDPRAKALGVAWPHTRAEVGQMTAFDAKRAGDVAEATLKQIGIDWVSFEGKRFPYRSALPGEHHALIVAAMREKLRQNPEVEKTLLSTGDLVLKPDHHQAADDPPEWRYFEIWMQLRAELQK